VTTIANRNIPDNTSLLALYVFTLFVYLSMVPTCVYYLSIHQSIDVSVCTPACLSVYLSVYYYVQLFIYLSVGVSPQADP
jgi:hypothetical protein